ncbi:probable glycosidase CRH1 [Kluyveromyces marxianus]|uniref:Crh-like protein n=1 Tax=Kluyveromyces marxianus (strain DMKU3-1042 / BCC 29191 / NBRC 104275) TaxID=1003335 RepID=W0TC08_KLUMD|nr:probable glycosidase CRH1 [Kluyveromyces marxianus DMKU3-1042]BAO40311.1 probable glycosidase CRH1 [Kluyveromyces marxianus DMKU3-1042]BAP71802.1 probable glycosidase CRH1 [Kluyveromyces marxianus]
MRYSCIASAIALSSSVAYAQEAACNPLKNSSCSPDPALGGSISVPFTEESSHFPRYAKAGNITYSDNGAEMTIAKRFDNPSVVSDFYLMFGKVQAIIKAAPGQGIISSFYLQSDDLDEIDIEWTGTDITQVQTNFFSKGVTGSYDRGQFHGVDDPQGKYHNYTIDWTKDQIDIYVDSALVRTITSDNGQGYPQSPMRIFIGNWAGGDPDNQPGTIEWAGGVTDYTKAPFSMFVKDLVAVDYSTGSEYSYSGTEGTSDSIEAKDGKVYGRYDDAVADFDKLVNGGTVADSEGSSSSSSSASESSTSSASSASATSSSKTTATTTTSSSSEKKTASSTSTSVSSSLSQNVTTTTVNATQITSKLTSSTSSLVSINNSISASRTSALNTSSTLVTSTLAADEKTETLSADTTTAAPLSSQSANATVSSTKSAASSSLKTSDTNGAAQTLPQLLAFIPAALLL